jgi:hypothetical protein
MSIEITFVLRATSLHSSAMRTTLESLFAPFIHHGLRRHRLRFYESIARIKFGSLPNFRPNVTT